MGSSSNMDLVRILSGKQTVTRMHPTSTYHTALVLKMIVRFFQTADAGYREHRLQHHALVDACSLKTAYRESTFDPPSPTAEGDENGD